MTQRARVLRPAMVADMRSGARIHPLFILVRVAAHLTRYTCPITHLAPTHPLKPHPGLFSYTQPHAKHTNAQLILQHALRSHSCAYKQHTLTPCGAILP